jgi:hypothetical protein
MAAGTMGARRSLINASEIPLPEADGTKPRPRRLPLQAPGDALR